MTEVPAGMTAPVENAPAANAVPAPDAPVVGNQAETEPVPSKTYTEEENRRIVNERLSKERKRLERVVRAELERDFYKQQLETRSQPQQTDRLQEPKPEQFSGNYEGYLRALAKYDRQVEREQEKEQEHKRSQQATTQQADVEFARTFQGRVDAASEKYPDLRDKLMEVSEYFTPPMIAALVQLDNGMDIAYTLAETNPKELARISRLPAIQQAIAFYEAGKKLAEPPKTTSAPPPIVPSAGQAKGSKSWEDMTTAEHVEAFIKRKRR